MRVERRGFLTLALGAIVAPWLPRGEAIVPAVAPTYFVPPSAPLEAFAYPRNMIWMNSRQLAMYEEFVGAPYLKYPARVPIQRPPLTFDDVFRRDDLTWPMSPQEILDGARPAPSPAPTGGPRNG